MPRLNDEPAMTRLEDFRLQRELKELILGALALLPLCDLRSHTLSH